MDKQKQKAIIKEQRQNKIPKALRGVHLEKKWKKKIFKHLYLPEDRDFLKSLVTGRKEGDQKFFWVDPSRMADLDKKQKKQLKAAAQAVKNNRKGLRFSLILILVILAGTAAAFQLHLKDALLARALREGLEATFQARCEVSGLHLDLAQSRLEIDRLAVTNKEAPLKNLFEVSRIAAQIRVAPLFQGRLRIDELQVEDLQRNTPRKTSGALETSGVAADEAGKAPSGDASGEKAPEEKAPEEKASALDSISRLAGDLDVQGLLEAEKEKMQSLSLAEESRQELEEETALWEEKLAAARQDMEAWGDKVAQVSRINPQSIDSISEATEAYQKIDGAVKSSQKNYNDVMKTTGEVQSSWKKWQGRAQEIREAADEDWAYLEGLVQSPAGDKAEWLASYLEEQLDQPLTRYYNWYLQGRALYDRFQELQSEDGGQKKETRTPREGRDLPLEPPAGPRIILGRVALSGQEPDISYQGEVKNLVSDPSRWEEPFRLKGQAAWGESRLNLSINEGRGEITADQLPFDLADSLSALGLGELKGKLSLKGHGAPGEGGAMVGGAELMIDNLEWIRLKEDDLTGFIEETLREAQPIPVNTRWTLKEGAVQELTVSTTLQDVLAAQMGAYLEEKAAAAKEELKGQWEALSAEYLADYQDELGQARKYMDQADAYRSRADNYEQTLEAKKEGVEARLEQLKKEAASQAQGALQQGLNSFLGN